MTEKGKEGKQRHRAGVTLSGEDHRDLRVPLTHPRGETGGCLGGQAWCSVRTAGPERQSRAVITPLLVHPETG